MIGTEDITTCDSQGHARTCVAENIVELAGGEAAVAGGEKVWRAGEVGDAGGHAGAQPHVAQAAPHDLRAVLGVAVAREHARALRCDAAHVVEDGLDASSLGKS
jgi:hypothetical protein